MVAVLIAVVANFILGFLWYTPLFGKAWAKEMGFDMSGKATGFGNGKGNDLYGYWEFLSRLCLCAQHRCVELCAGNG